MQGGVPLSLQCRNFTRRYNSLPSKKTVFFDWLFSFHFFIVRFKCIFSCLGGRRFESRTSFGKPIVASLAVWFYWVLTIYSNIEKNESLTGSASLSSTSSQAFRKNLESIDQPKIVTTFSVWDIQIEYYSCGGNCQSKHIKLSFIRSHTRTSILATTTICCRRKSSKSALSLRLEQIFSFEFGRTSDERKIFM